ncbi:MAG: aminodeoxychorismate/anthranilate synthase component II [Candidatus Caenarcaniphilales bacterium]|nr:aminodeoxychorismate/anthranilate synthase component II [Candidatus Caenarcaniphilales bacterium]
MPKLKQQHKVLVVDNYDSFVYNLVQYLGEIGAEVIVIRNDDYNDDQIISVIESQIKPSHILLSPGPGRPSESKICLKILKDLAGKIPILGVCLGMQALGEIYGAKVTYAPELMHGKTSEILVTGSNLLFENIPRKYIATRYHSLVLDRASVDACPNLSLEAITEDGTVMAVAHSKYPNLVGVQYHPESILSEYGHELLANFLKMD